MGKNGTCERCGKPNPLPKKHGSTRKFCSDACRIRAHEKRMRDARRVQKTCQQCEQALTTTDLRERYCSDECRLKAKRERQRGYSAKYREKQEKPELAIAFTNEHASEMMPTGDLSEMVENVFGISFAQFQHVWPQMVMELIDPDIGGEATMGSVAMLLHAVRTRYRIEVGIIGKAEGERLVRYIQHRQAG